jgi:hypothetical protein
MDSFRVFVESCRRAFKFMEEKIDAGSKLPRQVGYNVAIQLPKSKGVAERGSRTKGRRGGGPAEGRKKNCDLTNFDGGSGR